MTSKHNCYFCKINETELNPKTLLAIFINHQTYKLPVWNEDRTNIITDDYQESYLGPYYICPNCVSRTNELQPKEKLIINYKLTNPDVYGSDKYIKILYKGNVPLNKIEITLQKYGIPNNHIFHRYFKNDTLFTTPINKLTKTDIINMMSKIPKKTELYDIFSGIINN